MRSPFVAGKDQLVDTRFERSHGHFAYPDVLVLVHAAHVEPVRNDESAEA